jgi:hypothetical protein
MNPLECVFSLRQNISKTVGNVKFYIDACFLLFFEENEIEEKRQKVDLHKLPKSGFLLLLDFGGGKKREREKEGFAKRESRSACHREK